MAYPSEYSGSPQAFGRRSHYGRPYACTLGRANAMCVGSSTALGVVGLKPGGDVQVDQLVLVLEGKHAGTGTQVRRAGWRPPMDNDRQPRSDGRGEPLRELVVSSSELTLWAPKWVSVLWSQGDLELHAQIEGAMVVPANAAVSYLTQARRGEGQGPGAGVAASLALHVTARTARGRRCVRLSCKCIVISLG